MADMSWKAHLAALRKKNRLKNQEVNNNAYVPVAKSRDLIGIVSPDTPMVSPEGKKELSNDDREAMTQGSEDELSLRDSYLQRRILEITSSTSWLSSSMDDENTHNGVGNSDPKESVKNVVSPEGEEKLNTAKEERPDGPTYGDEARLFQVPMMNPLTPPRNAIDRYQPSQSESPSTHLSASSIASKKAIINLPSEKSSGRITISPGRKKEDSEFARKLESGGVFNYENDGNNATEEQLQIQQQRRNIEGEEKDTELLIDTEAKGRGGVETEDVWKTAKTADGRTYYYNRRTRISSWKLPDGATLLDSSHQRKQETISHSATSSSIDEKLRNKSGMYCMFCGLNASEHGSTLDEHLNMCTKFDSRSSDAVMDVHILARRMGILVIDDSLELGSRKSQNSQSSIKYEDSFDSFVSGEDTRASQSKEKCQYCGRTFAMGRLAHHERACRDAHAFKKVPYDSGRKRVQGTQLEFHVRSPSERPQSTRSSSKPTTPSESRRR